MLDGTDPKRQGVAEEGDNALLASGPEAAALRSWCSYRLAQIAFVSR
jgi:hypothetical protein